MLPEDLRALPGFAPPRGLAVFDAARLAPPGFGGAFGAAGAGVAADLEEAAFAGALRAAADFEPVPVFDVPVGAAFWEAALEPVCA